ncbi:MULTISPECIES: OmpA family protein [unclassified Undibacterium]|uniref:OmpA family protein n=2 Tax=Pseudomonadota TaxID=1224 RepID=UPI002AC97AF9|nr:MULTISPECIES: OmpA family protein [unclassified Undibacterium]MEB0138203.1 OmpA family protein [Undibacterium sp. CCC2.1]MEB0173976.1 OmpA family protein [Undibacterium sp. CCC1.1]MEB0176808.1 OmpA family protein [Undibacterium sp. CCC3.4]MEB0217163.1 OmpA family protein [Undibacterium sp. 5I2]WPX45323.1 OmpA family protein [Undibacterium sp. CCC3.4]
MFELLAPIPVFAIQARQQSARFLQHVLLLFFALCVLATGAHATPAPGGASISATATATYIPAGFTQPETVNSNTVQAQIQSVEALSLSPSQSLTRPPVSAVTISHLLSNTGNTSSSYTLSLANGGGTCPAGGALVVSGLKVVRDINNNGVVDPGEPTLTLNSAGVVTLAAGASMNLLISGTTPSQSSGVACVTLGALTALQSVSASSSDLITLGNNAALSLTKSASYSGLLIPGVSDIGFTVTANSQGSQIAQPNASAGALATAITVNGMPQSLILLSDVVPVGTQYNSASLQTNVTGALRLFRVAGDAPFNYRTSDAGAAAVEVAIGLAPGVPVPKIMTMNFSVRAMVTGNISNTSQSYYFDGSNPVVVNSNTVVISSVLNSIGLAKAAGVPRSNVDANGNADGTATVSFTLLVKNYGTAPLYDVQISDLIEGTGAGQFGTYTAQTVPGPNQYTIVAGSLGVNNQQANGVQGVVLQPLLSFTGQGTHKKLLAPGAVLPVGASSTVQFDVRFNTGGSTATLYNQARVTAAAVAGGVVVARDDSTDGSDPDPDGDGNPTNNSEVTPILTQLPKLSLEKTVGAPRIVSTGVVELDYTFTISNSGSSAAPNVRLLDNLNCTFGMDKPNGQVQSWEIVGKPVAQKGLLNIASNYTGSASCDRAGINNANAAASVPTAVGLSLVDGNRALAANQTETITLTVRLTQKPQSVGLRSILSNKAWAASYTSNAVNPTANMLVNAVSATADSILLAPTGYVYDSSTRLPVAGVKVTLARTATGRSLSPMSATDLYAGPAYAFNADGSVSMTTGADGSYQFALQSPKDLSTYTLSLLPPPNSGYVVPSQVISVQPGVYGKCGPVVANTTIPQNSDPTDYYFGFQMGVSSANGQTCDVVNNHIPLDRGSATGLVLKKEGNKVQAELGDFLDYALTLSNKTGVTLNGVSFTDALPPGLAYIKQSARLNGLPPADPAGGAGPSLKFSYPDLTLAPGDNAVVRYRVRVGVGAPTNGTVINRASAVSGTYQSNLASWKTLISGGVFADDAYAFGKVYLDCKRDGKQKTTEQSEEIGIPGVRLFLENGTSVITDIEGKWSLYGLKPVTHVLRLDQSSLPSGARLEVLDNRNAQAPESRFLDLKKGEFHKANFIVTNCDDAAMMDEVKARRAAIVANPDVEMEAQVRSRLDPEGLPIVAGDLRGLPASGQIGGATGAGFASTPTTSTAAMIKLPQAPSDGSSFVGSSAGNLSGTLTSSGAPSGNAAKSVSDLASSKLLSGAAEPGVFPQLPAAPAETLEVLLPKLENNSLEFIGLKDGDTLPSSTTNVRVKGDIGASLRLTVNEQVVDDRRVGKKASLPSKKVTAWEYIGVSLRAGSNSLLLEQVDEFGNVRDSRKINLIAPDKLGKLSLEAPETAVADARTPIRIKVRLTDANGVPVTVRAPLTLEADRGRWLAVDLNSKEPGTQVFMEGGTAEFEIVPPAEPGTMRVRVTSGNFVQKLRIVLLAEKRPMIGVGIVEGVLDLTNRGKLALGAMPAGAAFETELSGISSSKDNSRVSGRSAFFFKGTVKGEYLLTASFDSDKTEQERLFRDIRPDEFYPVYGDSSVKGFDAQSTQKLYVRIDKNRSYLLYGDFTTASSGEVRQLSQVNRSLTGVKNVYEDSNVRATSYLSRTSQTQAVEEFRSVGTSGPYFLRGNGGDFVQNSEQVEILVRDRNQANVILQKTALVRFVDYTIEPLTRRLLLTQAVSSVDLNLNPQSIRVTYEVDTGGPEFTVAGTDVQVKVNEQLQVGVVASVDKNPENQRKLAAATALARLGEHTSVAAEVVGTESDLNGRGNAGRLELRYQDEKLAIAALASKTSQNFDNPGASTTAGRIDAAVRAELKLDDTLKLRGEALYSKDALADDAQSGISVSAQKKIGERTVAELGVRHGQSNAGAVSSFDYGQISTHNGISGSTDAAGGQNTTTTGTSDDSVSTVRLRVSTQLASVPQAQVFIEGEQDINHSDRHVVAVGGNYAVTDKTRVYGRYELVSSLQGPYNLNSSQAGNVGTVGVESNYMEGGRVYNEYRLTDSIDGRGAQAAFGVRNTFKLDSRWSVTGGLERVSNLGSYGNSGNTGTGQSGALGSSTALISGVEYLGDRVKASGIAEARNGDDANTRLFSAGFAYKINPDWSLLTRNVYSQSLGQGSNAGNDLTLMRNQVGVAYRPVDQDVWNALARYEHKTERVGEAADAAGLASASSFGGSGNITLPGTYNTDIISANVNVNPSRGNYLTARYAAKVAEASDGTLDSTYWAHLLQGRYTRDLTKDWDIGVQAGVMYGKGGSLQKTAGLEIGYQVYKNLWLSGGYNFVGLTDRDLTGNEYTSKGVYLRLRFKFDETALGFAPVTAPVKVPVKAAPVPAPEPVAVPQPVAEEVVPPVATPLRSKTTFQANALFDSDQSALKPQGKRELNDFAARLREVDYDVVITMGHSDSRGDHDYNQRLSERRADTVRAYLIEQGIKAERIEAKGFGEDQPVASNATAAGRAKNRRVEIEVTGYESK